MKFTNSLIKGKLIKRYKRFFVDIKVKNTVITAHCPNTGSMQGLLDEGNEVWLTKNDDPNRKLKFTLEVIKVRNNLVGVTNGAMVYNTSGDQLQIYIDGWVGIGTTTKVDS